MYTYLDHIQYNSTTLKSRTRGKNGFSGKNFHFMKLPNYVNEEYHIKSKTS